MKLSKRQLKRIIREEYSRLKRRGLIREMTDGQPEFMPQHFQGGSEDEYMPSSCTEDDVIGAIEKILATQNEVSIWDCGVDDYTELAQWIGRMKTKSCSPGLVQDVVEQMGFE